MTRRIFHRATWLGRARSQCHRGLIKEGTEDYQRALALGGDRDIIDYELAAFGAANIPIAMPKSVVTRLFDEHAESFDEHLVQKLSYQTPIKIFNLISSYKSWKPLDVLDLGCGTGLMGEQLRPIAKKLCGVDISSNMLTKAERRAIYDELICEDIIKFLSSHSQTYDLVVAADVFVYFGDLTRVFELVPRVFRHQGYFCFSVEATNESEYVLRTTGRYQHSVEYLRRLAKNYGFVLDVIDSSVLRKESEKDVDGYIAMMHYS